MIFLFEISFYSADRIKGPTYVRQQKTKFAIKNILSGKSSLQENFRQLLQNMVEWRFM